MSEVISVNEQTGVVVLTATDVAAIPGSEAGQPNGVATLDSTGHLPGAQLPGSVVSGSTKQIDVTKAPYSVAPGVTAEPELKIQEAINQAHENYANASGPTEVYCPPGVYSGMKLHVIPEQTSQAAVLYMRTGVKLTWAEGASFQYSSFEKLPEGCTGAQFISNLHPYTNSGNTTEKVVLENADIDCNGSNQSEVTLNMGLFFGACKDCQRIRCRVRNLYGTASSGAGETFHFEDNNCLNCNSFFCEADGSAIANTATGFSADNTVGSGWINCTAHGMGHSQGFTHWQCADLTHVACWAYGNGQTGFNSERSTNIIYTACIGGGISALIGNGNGTNPFFPSGQEQLGNENGFVIQGSRHVTVDASCQSMYNTKWGVALVSDAATVTGVPELEGKTTNASVLVTGISSTTGLLTGMSIKGAGIPEGTVISEINSATELTMTNAATSSETRKLTFDTFRSCADVRVHGTHRLNTSNNIYVHDTAEATNGRQIDCLVFANATDGAADAMLLAAWAPLLLLENLGSGSGNRVQYKASTSALGKAYRLINANTSREPFVLNGGDQMLTLGRARSVRLVKNEAATQKSYDDIVAWTELTATRAYQLLKISELPEGTEIEIVDASGSASGTAKIELKAHEGDPLHGSPNVESAYGARRARIVNGAWICT